MAQFRSSSGNGAFTAVLLVWLFGVVLSLGVAGLIIWATIHFISKFW